MTQYLLKSRFRKANNISVLVLVAVTIYGFFELTPPFSPAARTRWR